MDKVYENLKYIRSSLRGQLRQDLTQFHRDMLKALYTYDESLNPML